MSFSLKSFLMYFNPRSREGSDAKCNDLSNLILNFNPRSREGSDFCTIL